MKPNEDQLRRLLEEALEPANAALGPSRAAVLAMVRRRRVARRCARAGLAAGVVIALSAWLWPREDVTTSPPSLIATRMPPPSPLVVKQVNDEELLALLKDAPVALMQWPNGDRTLLVVER